MIKWAAHILKSGLAEVQASPIFLNREASVEKACDLILEAGKDGEDFVAFPENFIPGHPVWPFYNISSYKISSGKNGYYRQI